MKRSVNYFFIIIFGLLGNSWIIGPKNGFVFDDWAYLYKFKFNAIFDFVRPLPTSTYNDRPVGEMFLKILYNFFYDNYQLYHSVFLVMHIASAILLYQITTTVLRTLKPKTSNYKIIGLVTALVFVVWPKSLMAVQWNSAIFDLLGTFIALIIFRLYLWHPARPKIQTLNTIILLLLFFVSLRTKEMFIVIPIILLGYELIKAKKIDKKLIRLLNPVITGQVVIAALYLMALIILKTNNNIVNDPTSPYFVSFAPAVIFENLFRYIFLYFNYGSVEFSFVSYNSKSLFLAIAFLLSLLVLAIKNKKSAKSTIITAVLFPISLLTVLPLKNTQHNLYLYFPSIFLSFAISALTVSSIKIFIKSINIQKYLAIFIVLVIGYVLINSRSLELYRNFWYSVAENNQKTYQSIQKISPPKKNSTIYVQNVNDAINSFIQGHGAVFWFSYNDPSLKMILNPTTIDRDQPNYLILNYDDGNVTEFERRD